jgi:hypothetical protein
VRMVAEARASLDQLAASLPGPVVSMSLRGQAPAGLHLDVPDRGRDPRRRGPP